MKVRLAALAALAVLVAGCGAGGGGGSGGSGGGSSSDDAASLVPADAVAYGTVDSDASSAQISSALKILDKFPIEARAEQQLRASLKQNGVDFAALTQSAGSEVAFAVLMVSGKPSPVGFAKPSDEKAFDAQVDAGNGVHTTVDGWTVFADKQAALDAVTATHASSLADDPSYQAAMKTVPAEGDAIARVYASAAGTQVALGAAKGSLGSSAGSLGSITAAKWIAGALTSQDDAFKLEVHAKAASTTASSASNALADQIPSGSIVALALSGGSAVVPASAQQQLSALGQQLGVDLPALVGALNGPVIAYVRPGIPLPEVTIAARPRTRSLRRPRSAG